jgi:hypothetical protein
MAGAVSKKRLEKDSPIGCYRRGSSMSANPENERRVTAYTFLLAVQIAGAFVFIWKELPAFNQLLQNPGQQLPYIPYDDLTTAGILLVMQVAYWYRLRRVPIPFQGPSLFLSHVLLFLGRLSFIFGAALFSVVFFRHLPALENVDIPLMAVRAVLLGVSLFALFCLTLEIERLGHALEGADPDC